MRGRIAGRLFWHCSSRPPALIEFLGLKNFVRPETSALLCPASSGAIDGALSSSELLPPFQRSLGGCYSLRNLQSSAASTSCHHDLPSSRSSSSNSHCHCTFAQSTPSNANTLQIRRFIDNAAKRTDRWCWSCGHETSTGNGLLCPSCKAIQPLDPTVDFFQILSIDRSFNVNPKVLEQNYKDLQKKLHPDLAGSKSQMEQGYSSEQSAHVIQAYYVLLRPLSRARYLLGLYGIKTEEGTIDDPELLMEIMEIRESIEEVSNAEALKNARTENDKRVLKCEKELENSFRDGDLNGAVSLVQRLAYYIKVGEEIIRKL